MGLSRAAGAASPQTLYMSSSASDTTATYLGSRWYSCENDERSTTEELSLTALRILAADAPRCHRGRSECGQVHAHKSARRDAGEIELPPENRAFFVAMPLSCTHCPETSPGYLSERVLCALRRRLLYRSPPSPTKPTRPGERRLGPSPSVTRSSCWWIPLARKCLRSPYNVRL